MLILLLAICMIKKTPICHIFCVVGEMGGEYTYIHVHMAYMYIWHTCTYVHVHVHIKLH